MRPRLLSDEEGMSTELDQLLSRLGLDGYRVLKRAPREALREQRREAWRTNRPPTPRKEKPRCGARTRGARGGRPCQAAGIGAGGRCKYHGGMSTGPLTEAGKARALSNLKQFRRPAADKPEAVKEAPAMRVRIVRRADVAVVNEQRQVAAERQNTREVRREITRGRPGEVRHGVESFDNGATVAFDPTRNKFVIFDSAGELHGFRQDREAARALAQSLKRKEFMP
jgi:hypothetical protein